MDLNYYNNIILISLSFDYYCLIIQFILNPSMKSSIQQQSKPNYRYNQGVNIKTMSSYYPATSVDEKTPLRSTINCVHEYGKSLNLANRNPLLSSIKSELSNLKEQMNKIIKRDSLEFPKENNKNQTQYEPYSTSNNLLIHSRASVEPKTIRSPIQWNRDSIVSVKSETKLVENSQKVENLNQNSLNQNERMGNYTKFAYLEYNKQPSFNLGTKMENQTEKKSSQNSKIDNTKQTTLVSSKKVYGEQQHYQNEKIEGEKLKRLQKQVSFLKNEIVFKDQQLVEKNNSIAELKKEVERHKANECENFNSKKQAQKLRQLLSISQKQIKKLTEMIKYKDKIIQTVSSEARKHQTQLFNIRAEQTKRKRDSENVQLFQLRQAREQALKQKQALQKYLNRDKMMIQTLTKAKQFAEKELNIIKQALNQQKMKLISQISNHQIILQKLINSNNQQKIVLQSQLNNSQERLKESIKNHQQQFLKQDLKYKDQINILFKAKQQLQTLFLSEKATVVSITNKNQSLQNQIKQKIKQFDKLTKEKQCLSKQFIQYKTKQTNFKNKSESVISQNQFSQKNQTKLNKEKDQLISNLHSEIGSLRYQIHLGQQGKRLLQIMHELTDQLNQTLVKKDLEVLNKKYKR